MGVVVQLKVTAQRLAAWAHLKLRPALRESAQSGSTAAKHRKDPQPAQDTSHEQAVQLRADASHNCRCNCSERGHASAQDVSARSSSSRDAGWQAAREAACHEGDTTTQSYMGIQA